MPHQESRHIHRHIGTAREQRCAVFLVKVAMNVHLRALRIDKQSTGVVVQVEGKITAFVSDLLPRFVLARLLPLPSHAAVVITGQTGDGSVHDVWPYGEPIYFHQSHGSAADL